MTVVVVSLDLPTGEEIMSRHLHETTDSHRWAEEFVDTNKGYKVGEQIDITVMINWFANYKSVCENKFKEKYEV